MAEALRLEMDVYPATAAAALLRVSTMDDADWQTLEDKYRVV